MSRRRRRRKSGKVELNLAAMLDMAFQLLAFFILTFKPMPVEGQLSMKLPPPRPVAIAAAGAEVGNDPKNVDPLQGVQSLIISAVADNNGNLASLAIGEGIVGELRQLERRLNDIFADAANPFDQVILQIGPRLKYEELLKVIEICAKQKLPNGAPLAKLSFVELPNAK